MNYCGLSLDFEIKESRDNVRGSSRSPMIENWLLPSRTRHGPISRQARGLESTPVLWVAKTV
jgi:hypothetical protein